MDFPEAFYHITSRGDRREVIFESRKDWEKCLDMVGDTCHISCKASQINYRHSSSNLAIDITPSRDEHRFRCFFFAVRKGSEKFLSPYPQRLIIRTQRRF